MKNFNIKNLKYRYRFFFTLDYLLKKIGIDLSEYYIYSLKLDDIDIPESKFDEDIVIKVCKENDLPLFGELEDLFLSDMQDGHILVAAFLDNEWVGYVWISLKPAFVEEVERFIHFDGAYLWRGYIKEDFRKMGIYKEMLLYSLNRIKNTYKKNKVYGIIETTNVPSIKGVERLNFSRIGTINYSRFFLWKKYEEMINDNTVTLLENKIS